MTPMSKVMPELPGLQQEMEKLSALIQTFAGPADDKTIGAVRGVVIEGPSGAGKTALARAVAMRAGLPWCHLSCPSVYGPNRGDAERCLQRVFLEAGEAASKASIMDGGNAACSILILDDVDSIGNDRRRARHVTDLGLLAVFLEALDEPACVSAVFVIGTTADATLLDTSLIQPGRLELIVRLGTPTLAQRKLTLEALLGRLPLSSKTVEEQSKLLESLTRQTRGFTGADLTRLCSDALAAACQRTGKTQRWKRREEQQERSDAPTVETTDWEAALVTAHPTGIPWSSNADVQLSDLAGIADIIEVTKQAVLLPLARPDALAAMGVSRASFGVLLHGEPGTGKSTLGRALAVAARPYASFLSIECPDLINKIVGESERALAQLFHAARQAAPCILFLDHVEAIAGKRGFDTSSEQTMDRLLSTLLIEMDGISSSSSSSAECSRNSCMVVVIAATNHIDLLDDAILRPGRLDLHVELPLPDQSAREAIFHHHLKALPLAFDHKEPEDEDQEKYISTITSFPELVTALAAATDNFSGADIQGVCQEAALLSLRESLDNTAVRPCHFQEALTQHI